MAPPAPDEGVTVQVCSLAEQLLAVAPPFDPIQLHDHGPLPPTVLADPELHKPVVGAVVKIPLFDDPHTPLIALVVKVADTVQLVVIALVVYVVPLRVPTQVPPTDAA
jgi:hypothetical protein